MKRWLFPLALLVVFLGLWFYTSRTTPPDEAGQEAEMLQVWQGAGEDVKQINLITPEQNVMLARSPSQGDKPGRWQLEATTRDVTADNARVEYLAGELAALQAKQLILEEAPDLDPFGLKNPRARARIELADGQKRELLVGSLTPLSDEKDKSYYAKDAAAPAVFTLPAALAEELAIPWQDWREKYFLEKTLPEQPVRVEVQQPGQPLLVLTKAGDDWQLSEPVQEPADLGPVNRLISRVRYLWVEGFPNDNPSQEDLAGFGLTSPFLMFSFQGAEGEPVEVRLGQQEGEKVYVQASNDPSVYLVKQSDLEDIPLSAEQFKPQP